MVHMEHRQAGRLKMPDQVGEESLGCDDECGTERKKLI